MQMQQSFNILVETIVSDYGFRLLSNLINRMENQSEVYKGASVSLGWTKEITETCKSRYYFFYQSLQC